MNDNNERNWQNFYTAIKDSNWPECPNIDHFSSLPKNIQQEILFVHKGHEHFIPDWHNGSTKKRVDIIPIDKKYNFLKPKNFPNFLRVGSFNDGGYIVPKKMIDLADAVLSGGLGSNWDFEISWNRLNPEIIIHAYDASVIRKNLEKEIADYYDNIWDNQKRIHFTKNLGLDFFPLSDAVKLLTVQNIFLKLDIEGSEYLCIDDIIENKNKIIGMALEFHDIQNYNYKRFESSIKKLQEVYEIVHLHGNNFLPYPPDGQIPYVLEITLIRKDYVVDDSLRNMVFLFDLDQPNDPMRCDWFLHFE